MEFLWFRFPSSNFTVHFPQLPFTATRELNTEFMKDVDERS